MQKLLEDELCKLPEGSSVVERNDVFKKVIGEDKYGYAKNYGKGVTVPRSRKKRCALEEERAKRVKIDEELSGVKERLGFMEKLLVRMAEHQVK